MEALEQEIKELIISLLSLEDVLTDDIDTNAPLFVEGLGLDSIDALELGIALQRRYGIVLDGEKSEMKERFASVAALARYVSAQRVGQAA